MSNSIPISSSISNQLRIAYNFKEAGKYSTLNYLMFHEANEETRNRVLSTVYQTYIQGKLPPSLTTKDNGDPNKSGSTKLAKSNMNIDALHTENGEYVFDNLYNLINTVYHENNHFISSSPTNYSFAHYEILKKQTSHTSWGNTTENYKQYIKGVAEGYLNEMESLTVGVASFVDYSKNRKNIFKTKSDEASFKKYYADYASAIKHYNKTFNEKRKIISKKNFQASFVPPAKNK